MTFLPRSNTRVHISLTNSEQRIKMRPTTFLSLTAFSLIALLAIMASSSTSAAEAPIITYDLSALPDSQFDLAGWSAAADVAGVKCRKALAAKATAARINAWWKESDLRPAEGDTFILEVKYQDVLSKPAQFSVNSGIGSRFGNYPLHLFGGANDNAWKTANIPCPWDMVARLVSSIDPAHNAPAMTSFTIAASADLPIATVTVRRAVPEDETRFYAECRQQIALEQAADRAKNPRPAVKDPPPLKDALVLFPWDPIRRMGTNQPIPADQIGKAVKIRACLNQLESGSLGVYANGAALTGVDYEITPLLDGAGNVLKATVERRTAEYCLLDGTWTPMRLWKAYAVDVPAGQCQWLYFHVQTRRGQAQAGQYKGKIIVSAKEGKAELPLEVEVLNVDLLTMQEAGLGMYGCYDKLPPLHDIDFEASYNYTGALLWYSSFTIPVALQNDKLTLDFTYPDNWMKGARQRGFNGAIWYLGGNPYGFPRTMSVFAHLGTLDKKMTRQQWCQAQMEPQNREHVLPETRQLFVDWMRQVNGHAVTNNWLELYPTPHDEPQKYLSDKADGDKSTTLGTGPWIKSYFKDGCAAIREADPRIHIYGCIHHVANWKTVAWNTFIDDIDVYNTNDVQDDNDIGNKIRSASAASVKKGGHEKWFWQYTGLGGGLPENQRYSFGFYYGAFASTGCTAWAYNWNDAWDLSGRKGDLAVTAWPTAYQTIPSPWFEGQRAGLDDRRVIATYQKKFAADPDAIKVLDRILEKAKSSRSAKSGNDTVNGFFDSLDDSAKLTDWRNTLLDRLAAAR